MPAYFTAVVEVLVRGQDKWDCTDSISIANGMIRAGMSCQLIQYMHEEHDSFFEVCGDFDVLILRCKPGQIEADGGSQDRFDEGMRRMRKQRIQVWPSPDVVECMGAKDVLCKVAGLSIGLSDTLAYTTADHFSFCFRKTMAFQPRVVQASRCTSGEGMWTIKLMAGNYCRICGERACADDEVLHLTEANDNHSEQHTVAEFIEFCVNGHTGTSGTWTSKGLGKYLADGPLLDQRFCPRIAEGELRFNMLGDVLVSIIHQTPNEVADGTGSNSTVYAPEEPRFKSLTESFLSRDVHMIMPSLGLANEPLPLLWSIDLILASPEGTAADQEKWAAIRFSCCFERPGEVFEEEHALMMGRKAFLTSMGKS